MCYSGTCEYESVGMDFECLCDKPKDEPCPHEREEKHVVIITENYQKKG